MRKLLAFLLLCLVGCAPAYNQVFLDEAKERGWTDDQSHAALAYSYRLMFLDDELKVKYSMLDKQRVYEKLEQFRSDVDWLLDYKDADNARYVDEFGLREALTRKEDILTVISSRQRAALLYDKFTELTGNTDGYHHAHAQSDSDEMKKKKGFEWKVYLPDDLADLYTFELDKVNNAKAEGKLEEVERSHITVARRYNKRVQDLAHPDDPAKFKWEPMLLGLDIHVYKLRVDMERPPLDNHGDYLEAFRHFKFEEGGVKVDKKESKPVLKAFRTHTGTVVVIDVHREGQPGYGSPDFVEKTHRFDRTSDIFSNSQLVELIFEETKKKNNRVKPEVKPLFLEVAKVGTPVDVWEDAPNENGWLVPFPFKNKTVSNYNVKIEFEKTDFDANRDRTVLVRKVESFRKEWTNNGSRYVPCDGAVVEFYRPKEPYNKELSRAVVLHFQDTKRVHFVFSDGSEEQGTIVPGANKFFEDEPFAVEYSEGDSRYRIEKHGDSKVFNKRKRTSTDVERTGVYTTPSF